MNGAEASPNGHQRRDSTDAQQDVGGACMIINLFSKQAAVINPAR